MILSYEQIRKVKVCPDCAKRQVDIATFPNAAAYFATTGRGLPPGWPVSVRDVAVNVIEVRHDPGCPKLTNRLPLLHLTEIEIHPVELADDHPWALKLREMEKQ